MFLIDDSLRRLSVLYVPSGKTKRKISKLQPLLEDVTTIAHTRNGRFNQRQKRAIIGSTRLLLCYGVSSTYATPLQRVKFICIYVVWLFFFGGGDKIVGLALSRKIMNPCLFIYSLKNVDSKILPELFQSRAAQ